MLSTKVLVGSSESQFSWTDISEEAALPGNDVLVKLGYVISGVVEPGSHDIPSLDGSTAASAGGIDNEATG